MHEIRERIATREPCAKCVRIDEKKKKKIKKVKLQREQKKIIARSCRKLCDEEK